MLDSLMGASPAVGRIQSLGARMLRGLGLSADAVTLLGAAAGIMAAIAFGAGSAGWGIAALAVSAALDALDGTLARQFGGASAFGGILDLSSDRLVEIAVIVGIVWRAPELYFAALVLVGSWYVNITIFLSVGAALDRRGPKLIDYPPGIVERTEALIFFAILALVEQPATLRPLGSLLCYLFAALEIATGVQRLLFGYRTLTRQGSPR